MHTLVVIYGVIVTILLVLALITMIAGIVWAIFPLKEKISIGDIYWYIEPMGGRQTGFIMFALGIAGFALGLLLDKEHDKLSRKYGARI